MKKFIPVFIINCLLPSLLHSQNIINTGKPIAEIFTDFHLNLDNPTKTTGFGLNRAYIGYSIKPEGSFSGTLIVNIGNPDDLVEGSIRRRYAYFREASVSYAKDKLIVSFGITGTRIFDFQQKFWGKRYIANTYQSINGYGSVADLGVAVDYKFDDTWKGDITIMNGEGFSDIQLDNSVRASAGLTFTPVKQIAARIYGDVENPDDRWRYMIVAFFGFKNDLLTIGGEVSYKSNLDAIEGHDAWGISATGGINIFKKTELFTRYDYSTSVNLSGESHPWNWPNDDKFSVYGVQYTFNENVRMALNYQGIYPYNPGNHVTDAIYVNAMFRF
jgi:hypothetical protein